MLQLHGPYFADGETETEKRLSCLICGTQWYRIKLGINVCQGAAQQPVSTGQVRNAFPSVRKVCINKTLRAVETKYLEEVEGEATYSSACFTQHSPASPAWILKRKKIKGEKFNISLMKISGKMCL